MQYDRRSGDLEVTEFVGESAREEALAARVQAESTRASEDVEVVVLSADSLDELKRTHGRYFKSAPELCARPSHWRTPSGSPTTSRCTSRTADHGPTLDQQPSGHPVIRSALVTPPPGRSSRTRTAKTRSRSSLECADPSRGRGAATSP